MMKRLLPRTLAVLAAAVLAACGGGGGGGAVPGGGGGGGGGGSLNSSSVVITASPSGPASGAFPNAVGGVTASVTVPATSSGSGQLTGTLTLSPPTGVPTVQSVTRRPQNIGGTLTPVAYITVASNTALKFDLTPGVTVTVPPSTTLSGAYGYLALFDPSTSSWTAVAGATTLVGGQYVFSPLDAAYTVTPGASATFAVFSSGSLVAVTPPGNTDPTTCLAYAETAAGFRRAPRPTGASSVVPDRLYVTLHGGQRAAQSVGAAVRALRSVPLGAEGDLVHEAITLPPGSDAARATAQLRAAAGVVDVQPVHRRYISADAAANDPLLDNDNQWYLSITHVDPGAWAITHGTGIKVAVIDTGVDQTNQDLLPKLDKTEGIVGGIITGSAQDTNGHGTNVSGLVAASDNNGYGFASTGWDVHLLVYKVFPDTTSTSSCQSADTADESVAIRDAVANGASVISLSLGGASDAAERAAVNFALSNNVTVVAANGNSGPGNAPDFPAGYPGVIGVGASSVSNATANVYASIVAEGVASYSNDSPALVAPGGDASGFMDNDLLHWIEGYSTTTANLPADRCSGRGGVCRVLFNGTSQATPQVAAAAALLMAKHGGARSLTPSNVLSLLQASADVIPGVSATRQGAGRLDVQAALSR